MNFSTGYKKYCEFENETSFCKPYFYLEANDDSQKEYEVSQEMIICSLHNKNKIQENAFRISASFYFKMSEVNSAFNSLNMGSITQEEFNHIYNNSSIDDESDLSDEYVSYIVAEIKHVLHDLNIDSLDLSAMFSRNMTQILAEAKKINNSRKYIDIGESLCLQLKD